MHIHQIAISLIDHITLWLRANRAVPNAVQVGWTAQGPCNAHMGLSTGFRYLNLSAANYSVGTYSVN